MWTAEAIKELRNRYGESREQFAARLRISRGTLRDLEQSLRSPSGPAEIVLDRLQEDLLAGKPRPLQSA